MTIQNDYQLDAYAKEIAQDIRDDIANYGGDAYDMAHEHADGSEHVIYYYKAHQICQNCNTDDGEAFLEEIGTPENPTYDSLATLIAYGELRARIMTALDEIGAE